MTLRWTGKTVVAVESKLDERVSVAPFEEDSAQVCAPMIGCEARWEYQADLSTQPRQHQRAFDEQVIAVWMAG